MANFGRTASESRANLTDWLSYLVPGGLLLVIIGMAGELSGLAGLEVGMGGIGIRHF